MLNPFGLVLDHVIDVPGKGFIKLKVADEQTRLGPVMVP